MVEYSLDIYFKEKIDLDKLYVLFARKEITKNDKNWFSYEYKNEKHGFNLYVSKDMKNITFDPGSYSFIAHNLVVQQFFKDLLDTIKKVYNRKIDRIEELCDLERDYVITERTKDNNLSENEK